MNIVFNEVCREDLAEIVNFSDSTQKCLKVYVEMQEGNLQSSALSGRNSTKQQMCHRWHPTPVTSVTPVTAFSPSNVQRDIHAMTEGSCPYHILHRYKNLIPENDDPNLRFLRACTKKAFNKQNYGINSIQDEVKKWEAELPTNQHKKRTSHAGRSTGITTAITAGVSHAQVALTSGHTNPANLQGYVQPTIADRAVASHTVAKQVAEAKKSKIQKITVTPPILPTAPVVQPMLPATITNNHDVASGANNILGQVALQLIASNKTDEDGRKFFEIVASHVATNTKAAFQ